MSAPFSVFVRKALALAPAALFLLAGLQGCARVMQKDREFLSDPVMSLRPDELGAGLESHNLPRREGSAGGGSGSGGGCGC
jgi:hypothetical protein